MKKILDQVKNNLIYFFYRMSEHCLSHFKELRKSPALLVLIVLFIILLIYLFYVALIAIILFLSQATLASIINALLEFTVVFFSIQAIYLAVLMVAYFTTLIVLAAIDTARIGNKIFYHMISRTEGNRLNALTDTLYEERLTHLMKFITLSAEDEHLLLTQINDYFDFLNTERKATLLAYCRRAGSDGFHQRLEQAFINFISHRPFTFYQEEERLLGTIKTTAQALKSNNPSLEMAQAARQSQSLNDIQSLRTNQSREEIETQCSKLLRFTASVTAYQSVHPDRDAPIKAQATILQQHVDRLLTSLKRHNV
jgi:hypothetical protein